MLVKEGKSWGNWVWSWGTGLTRGEGKVLEVQVVCKVVEVLLSLVLLAHCLEAGHALLVL